MSDAEYYTQERLRLSHVLWDNRPGRADRKPLLKEIDARVAQLERGELADIQPRPLYSARLGQYRVTKTGEIGVAYFWPETENRR